MAAVIKDLPIESWQEAIGLEGVILDPDECSYYSCDVYRSGETVGAVLRPTSVDALAAAVKAATEAGVAIYCRGGGFSYTDAYLAEVPNAVCLDTSGLDQVVEINVADRYVTVQAGCTWAKLDESLRDSGLRPPFWGPLSGLNATIGGAISQGALSLGSGKYGVSGESVLGVRVVTANGTVFDSGSASQGPHGPFFRNYGPDLTGLFCGDSGALGVKAEITLRLVRRRPFVHGLSFGCTDFANLLETLSAIALVGEATESFGFTVDSLASSAASAGFIEDLKMLWQIGRSSPSALDGGVQMAKTAIAGRRFLDRVPWTAHCVVEAENRTQLNGHVKALRSAVGDFAKSIPNTVPSVIRAAPFQAHDTVTAEGKRMLPMHVLLPFSQVSNFHRGYEALMRDRADDMSAVGLNQAAMFATVGVNAFLYEPVLMWKDKLSIFHVRHAKESVQQSAASYEENLPARQLVNELKSEIATLMFEHGGVHTQIGRMYPYQRDRQSTTTRMLTELKQVIDPSGLINPGALGLASRSGADCA